MSEGVPLHWVERHVSGAVRAGLSLDTLLADATIEPRFGDSRDYVTPTQYLLLCMTTMLALNDASHGLASAKIGLRYPATGLRIAMGYATLGEALDELCRFHSMASPVLHVRVHTDHNFATLSVHTDARTTSDAMVIEEIYLGWIHMICSYLLGRALPVHEVILSDPHHFNLGGGHWALRGTVTLGNVTAFRFPRHLLNARISSSGEARAFWDCNRAWLANHAGHGWGDSVSQYVRGSDFVRFSDLARDAGQSTSALRRHLKSETGDGFRQARRRALIMAATERLFTSNAPVDQIAIDLGYSDGRSFRRFVKTATGLTPQDIRAGIQRTKCSQDTLALGKLKALAEGMNI